MRSIKTFANCCETADGPFSGAGLNEYLLLLSLYVTCKYWASASFRIP
jgi:hypothetical protein